MSKKTKASRVKYLKERSLLQKNALSVAISSALASSMTLPTLAVAQQDGSEIMLEEVTVTASRRAESVQDIPYNITAATGDSLSKRGVENLTEFVRTVPGLTSIDTGARNNSPLVIRGLSFNELDANDNKGSDRSPLVSRYLGETPLLIDLKLFDMNRVEVLRGPQGTLYGSGSLGGTIRYIPNRPDTQDFYAEVGAKVYSINESDGTSFDTQAIVNIPFADGRAALRAAVGFLDEKGFVDYPLVLANPGVDNTVNPQEDVNDEETTSLRLSLLWDISDRVDAMLSYYFQDQETGGRQAVNPGFTGDQSSVPGQVDPNFRAGDYDSTLRYLEPNDRETSLATLEITADLDIAELTSVTSMSKIEADGQRDQTDLLVGFDYGYENFPQFSAFTRDIEDSDIFTQEIRFVSNTDGPLSWIGGIFYQDDEFEFDTREFTPGFPDYIGLDRPDNLEFVQFDKIKNEEIAIYGEIGYRFTEKFQATVGARAFELEQSVATAVALPLYPGTPGSGLEGLDFAESSGEATVDDTIFKFNASYDFNTDVMGYLTIAEGFRRGGANAVPGGSVIQGGQVVPEEDRFYEPDTATNYEIGVRSSLLDNRLVFNAAAYYIDWENIQVAGVTVNNLPITRNGGDASSQGIEVEFQAAITSGFTLSGGFATTDAQLEDDVPSIDGQSGDKVPGVPEFQFSLAGEFIQPLNNGWEILYVLDTSYTDEITTRVNDNITIGNMPGADPSPNIDNEVLDSYNIWNFSVTLTTEQWDLSFYIDNLTDEYAFTGARGPRDYLEQGQFKYVVRPMTAGLGFKYRF